MVEMILFLALAAAVLLSALALSVWAVIWGVKHLRGTDRTRTARGIRRSAIVLGGGALMLGGVVLFSVLSAHTPAISGDGSVSELICLTLNGRKEWVSIRGEDREKPVLLFLAGGPGGTQMAAVRHELGELEKHFVVVNWDQPGAGKSFRAVKTEQLTVETYIEDGFALTEYLRERFGQEKIYLVGESWGSALGVMLAARYPEFYHALVGTGQMVDFLETELLDYEKAMEIARARGDAEKLAKLEQNGPPPYSSAEVTFKSMEYLNYLSSYMSANSAITGGGYQTFRDIFSPEYSVIDKLNYILGLAATFGQVYPQLYGVDLRMECPRVDVPTYFFLGRHDINAPTALAQEYLESLKAPRKGLIWFEHSGHSPWINESEKFAEELLRVRITHVRPE